MLPALFVFALALTAQPPPPEPSEALVAKSQQAKELMGAGRFDEAIPICQELVKALPGNPGLLLNLALAQHMAGRDHDAVPNFETVLKLSPKNVPALVSLGASRLALGEPKLAVAPFERALAIEPGNQDARGMLAGALLESGSFEKATEQYRMLSDKSPDDPRAWFGLGKAYEALGASAFERLQKIDPKSPYVSVLVADTRVARRQFRSAFFFYNEALKQLPNVHGVHSSVAELYRKTGHQDWAAAEDAKEQTLPPADCKAHPAECQFAGGHDVQATALPAKPTAESYFWQAKAANELAMQAFFRLGQLPPSVELHQFRAEIDRNLGQHLEAAQEWREAIKLSPRDVHLHYELSVSLFMGKDYKATLAEAEPLLRALPKSAELNFIIGDTYLRLEDPEKGIPYLRSALKLEPTMLAANASLGLSLFRMGNAAEAVPQLERALELDDDGTLHFQLSRAYQATGAAEKARVTLAKYEEIRKRNQRAMDDVAREAQIAAPTK